MGRLQLKEIENMAKMHSQIIWCSVGCSDSKRSTELMHTLKSQENNRAANGSMKPWHSCFWSLISYERKKKTVKQAMYFETMPEFPQTENVFPFPGTQPLKIRSRDTTEVA